MSLINFAVCNPTSSPLLFVGTSLSQMHSSGNSSGFGHFSSDGPHGQGHLPPQHFIGLKSGFRVLQFGLQLKTSENIANEQTSKEISTCSCRNCSPWKCTAMKTMPVENNVCSQNLLWLRYLKMSATPHPGQVPSGNWTSFSAGRMYPGETDKFQFDNYLKINTWLIRLITNI